MLGNYSTQFILLSWYVIVQLIWDPCIFSLIIEWEISPAFIFGLWRSCICTCQTKKIIIVMVKEEVMSFWLAYVGHQIQLDSTNGTLVVIHLPTDLARITMIISCFWRLEMHVDLCDIPTQTWIGTSAILCLFELFSKVLQFNLLF